MPNLRPESPADAPAIRAIHLAAFPAAAEADLVDRLRTDPDWLWSMVAESDGHPVGHILLTRVRIDDAQVDTRFGAIGPVAVMPAHHGRGIGTTLNRSAIEAARAMRLGALFVLGDPAFYGRFGFVPASTLGLRCAWDGTEDAFRAIVIDPSALPPPAPDGVLRTVRYHAAFDVF